jgi:ketosteroid isomerase-like protein
MDAEQKRAIIERSIDASNRGDLETVFGLCDPRIEIDDPERSGTSIGHEGLVSFAQEWLENFEDYSVEIHNVEDGPDGTFVALTQHGKGKGSGIEFALPLHYAIRFRDGKISYFGIRTHAEDARREVGLPT